MDKRSRLGESSVAQKSSKRKTGLSTIYEEPSYINQTHVVFRTKRHMPSSNFDDSEQKLTDKTCFLSDKYMPHSLFCGPNQNPRDIWVESSSQNPNNLDITLNLLPLTKCRKHGHVGFLPLDYISKFPEYNCTNKKFTIFHTLHSFEDCVFEFPRIQPIGSLKQRVQEFCLTKCYQCNMRLSLERDIYMYRDCVFCGIDCRNKASAARKYYNKMMKTMNKGGAESSLARESIFTIEFRE